MRPGKKGYLLLTALAVMVAGVLLWQRWSGQQLRAEIGRYQAVAAERGRLDIEQQRLAAQQVGPAEQKRRREEREQLTALLVEIEGMRRRAQQAATAGARPATVPVRVDIREQAVPAAQWRNAGQAEPTAAFETALWAAAGGDLDALAATLALDERSLVKARALFARQPAVLRQEIGSPEKLIALLTAKDVPLGSARVTREFAGAEEMKLAVEMTDTEGQAKQAVLALELAGDRWRLVVPASAIDRYVSPNRPNAIPLEAMTVAPSP